MYIIVFFYIDRSDERRERQHSEEIEKQIKELQIEVRGLRNTNYNTQLELCLIKNKQTMQDKLSSQTTLQIMSLLDKISDRVDRHEQMFSISQSDVKEELKRMRNAIDNHSRSISNSVSSLHKTISLQDVSIVGKTDKLYDFPSDETTSNDGTTLKAENRQTEMIADGFCVNEHTRENTDTVTNVVSDLSVLEREEETSKKKMTSQDKQDGSFMAYMKEHDTSIAPPRDFEKPEGNMTTGYSWHTIDGNFHSQNPSSQSNRASNMQNIPTTSKKCMNDQYVGLSTILTPEKPSLVVNGDTHSEVDEEPNKRREANKDPNLTGYTATHREYIDDLNVAAYSENHSEFKENPNLVADHLTHTKVNDGARNDGARTRDIFITGRNLDMTRENEYNTVTDSNRYKTSDHTKQLDDVSMLRQDGSTRKAGDIPRTSTSYLNDQLGISVERLAFKDEKVRKTDMQSTTEHGKIESSANSTKPYIQDELIDEVIQETSQVNGNIKSDIPNTSDKANLIIELKQTISSRAIYKVDDLDPVEPQFTEATTASNVNIHQDTNTANLCKGDESKSDISGTPSKTEIDLTFSGHVVSSVQATGEPTAIPKQRDNDTRPRESRKDIRMDDEDINECHWDQSKWLADRTTLIRRSENKHTTKSSLEGGDEANYGRQKKDRSEYLTRFDKKNGEPSKGTVKDRINFFNKL